MPVLLIVFCVLIVLFGINRAALNRAEEINGDHNHSEKDNPKFVPATESDAKNVAGCITLIFAAILLLILLFAIGASHPYLISK